MLHKYDLKYLKVQHKAFTLAEVLITLGIIGVVAAMTMPVLINKYQEQVTVNKVKKFYSMINQALLMSTVDNGEISEWNYENVSDFANYLKPYLKIINDCGTSSQCLSQTYKTLNNYEINYNNRHYYSITLADGSYFWFIICDETDINNDIYAKIWYDTNGSKKPNVLGRDLFHFHLGKNKLKPAIDNECNLEGLGNGCAKYILINGNMDYLHK